jgi:hypothetical protein
MTIFITRCSALITRDAVLLKPGHQSSYIAICGRQLIATRGRLLTHCMKHRLFLMLRFPPLSEWVDLVLVTNGATIVCPTVGASAASLFLPPLSFSWNFSLLANSGPPKPLVTPYRARDESDLDTLLRDSCGFTRVRVWTQVLVHPKRFDPVAGLSLSVHPSPPLAFGSGENGFFLPGNDRRFCAQSGGAIADERNESSTPVCRARPSADIPARAAPRRVCIGHKGSSQQGRSEG